MFGSGRSRLGATALLATISLSAALASLAWSENVQRDGIRISVTGKLTPSKLPRSGAAPIVVSVGGRIAATKAEVLPRLLEVAIAINSHGRLDSHGLPRCRLGHIDPSTTVEALAACRSSLIGEGSFSADVKIPEQSPFPSRGKVLAFNGRLRGRPAVFAHIYGTTPVPTSVVLPFSIKRTKGTYGTVLEASLPQATGEWGYVTGIAMTLGRDFAFRGRPRSYLVADCPAPAGFTGAVFSLLKTSFRFDGGLSLSSTLTRSCEAIR